MPSLLKTVATSLVLLAVVAGMQGSLLVQGIYLARYDYVAGHLCENRNNPEVDCDGFCFLADRVAEAHGHGDDAAIQMSRARADVTSILPDGPAVPPSPTHEIAFPPSPLLAPSSGVSPIPYRPPWG